jgi:hypothetical protein
MPLVCKKGDARGRAHPFVIGGEHGSHPNQDGLFTVWKVVLYVREWNVGKGEDRTQYVGFSQSIKEVWEGQGSMGRSVLQEKGRLGEGIISKTAILAPGDNVDTGR